MDARFEKDVAALNKIVNDTRSLILECEVSGQAICELSKTILDVLERLSQASKKSGSVSILKAELGALSGRGVAQSQNVGQLKQSTRDTVMLETINLQDIAGHIQSMKDIHDNYQELKQSLHAITQRMEQTHGACMELGEKLGVDCRSNELPHSPSF